MNNPFTGKLMHCALCNNSQQSDPEVESNWRCIRFQLKSNIYYICPTHFPADNASRDEFAEAYIRVLKTLILRPGHRPRTK